MIHQVGLQCGALQLSFVLIVKLHRICVILCFSADNSTMDEPTTLQIEAKLERERTNIALLEQNLEKYNSLTINASNILQNFEQRLLKVGFILNLIVSAFLFSTL